MNVSIKNIFIEDRKFIVNTDFEISRIIKKALQKKYHLKPKMLSDKI